MRKKLMSILAMLLAMTLLGTACATTDEAESSTEDATPTSATDAADLRAGLTQLLTEHVYLSALATGSALRGDDAGFEAYAAALNGPSDSNTADLTAAVTSVYGEEVGNAFDGLWRSDDHIPAFVRYTQAVAAGDEQAKQAAVDDALAYAATFGETMNSVNDNLPADVVTAGVETHVTTLKSVIDAQAAGDATATATSLREAAGHMGHLAYAIAEATVQKFPESF